jgi:hypothetical protein
MSCNQGDSMRYYSYLDALLLVPSFMVAISPTQGPRHRCKWSSRHLKKYLEAGYSVRGTVHSSSKGAFLKDNSHTMVISLSSSLLRISARMARLMRLSEVLKPLPISPLRLTTMLSTPTVCPIFSEPDVLYHQQEAHEHRYLRVVSETSLLRVRTGAE